MLNEGLENIEIELQNINEDILEEMEDGELKGESKNFDKAIYKIPKDDAGYLKVL